MADDRLSEQQQEALRQYLEQVAAREEAVNAALLDQALNGRISLTFEGEHQREGTLYIRSEGQIGQKLADVKLARSSSNQQILRDLAGPVIFVWRKTARVLTPEELSAELPAFIRDRLMDLAPSLQFTPIDIYSPGSSSPRVQIRYSDKGNTYIHSTPSLSA